MRLAGKIARLRIFENDEGRFDRSLLDVGGEALVVSQFTLYGDTTKGNSPELHRRGGARRGRAARRPRSRPSCASLGVRPATGRFGARMEVELVNDGPVTIVFDV